MTVMHWKLLFAIIGALGLAWALLLLRCRKPLSLRGGDLNRGSAG